MKLINLGCGERTHTDWTNYDIKPFQKGVIKCNLLKKLPIPDNSCDAVYHSHVIEHLQYKEALAFLKNLKRMFSNS